jgi:hypothetical protein
LTGAHGVIIFVEISEFPQCQPVAIIRGGRRNHNRRKT